MSRRAFDKWKISRLNWKIDRLLLKSDDEIGKKYRHEDLKLSLLPPLLTALTILIPIIGIIFAIFSSIDVCGWLILTSPLIMIAVFAFYTLLNDFLDDFEIIGPCRNAWYDVITSHLDPIPEAMRRWRYWNHYDVNSMISICYDYLFKENVDELLEDSESLTDAEYGRLVKPILAYIKVCLTIDDGNDSELREEFIRKTDLERFLHETVECEADRKKQLKELEAARERDDRDSALGQMDVVTKAIGMDRPTEEVTESPEMRRLNDVIGRMAGESSKLRLKIRSAGSD